MGLTHWSWKGVKAVVELLLLLSMVNGCGGASCDSVFSSPIQGYMLGILSACLSALAGVYTKFLMKKNNDSLYWQNVQLYTTETFVKVDSGNGIHIFRFGSIFNMGHLQFDDFRGGFEKGPWWERLFNGYSIVTWMVVLNLGSTGLLVSWLMKYADNVVKVSPLSFCCLLYHSSVHHGDIHLTHYLLWMNLDELEFQSVHFLRLLSVSHLGFILWMTSMGTSFLLQYFCLLVFTCVRPHIHAHIPLSESASSVGAGLAAPAAESGRMPMAEVFKLAVSSFKVNDWGLFGNATG
ncbi:hypothetical protein RHMOL_Rhmol05G0053700 [Rhododendron molle]|uniref:Uncharacterized protein n=1 Tax=Rhododendron molle TaxID=49168 RepID=A0ACC0NMX1_RHOML|nr:hypothetical protein RHMOL_Rhmol05G0053700 [Rhododendron molle]